MAEMLVAILVGLLVMVGLHQMFVASLTSQTTTSFQVEVDRKAQVAMDDIIARLRGSSGVLVDHDPAHPDRIAFTDQDGQEVRYWVDSGNLRRALGATSYSGGAVLASNVGELVFTCYWWNPDLVPPREQETLLASKAKRVRARLKVQEGNNSSVLQSTVRLRNK